MASQRTTSSLSRRIASKVCVAACAALALTVLAAPVLACRPSQFRQATLLAAIPSAADDIEVIANVEIVDIQIRQAPGRVFHVARARVLKSIRGVADGQIVEIDDDDMCGGGVDRDHVGFRGFIAGRFVPFGNETYFRGRWSEAQLGGFSVGLWQLEPRPWWRAPWHTYYTPWYYRGALIALFLYLLWRVAGWLDRREGNTG